MAQPQGPRSRRPWQGSDSPRWLGPPQAETRWIEARRGQPLLRTCAHGPAPLTRARMRPATISAAPASGGPARVPVTGRPGPPRQRGERRSDPGPREATPYSKRLLPLSHRARRGSSGPGITCSASSWLEKSRPPGQHSGFSELRSTPVPEGGLHRSQAWARSTAGNRITAAFGGP
ncbi:hypothetical protein NDU88_004176 [Pleurodeles waltl]|uniref:Uncharacterized protein n=1 Tax=Pleurodeles waltl TaxID=8319 RepID=A0AAV7VHX5_PLEWA|nr:hypothetical protein NDU88_004176 [Pleurodeles waltl]